MGRDKASFRPRTTAELEAIVRFIVKNVVLPLVGIFGFVYEVLKNDPHGADWSILVASLALCGISLAFTRDERKAPPPPGSNGTG